MGELLGGKVTLLYSYNEKDFAHIHSIVLPFNRAIKASY